MATKIKNSLSTFLEQSLILEKNSLETISKMNNAMTSGEESITITLTDPNDPTKTNTYQIPSFVYLKRAIERIDNTLNTITNVGGRSNSSIRLSDGTYRKIITSSIPSEAPSITTVNKVTNFNFKSNWFFEDMLNPCLFISWDMSDQISSDTSRVLVQRFILTCDTMSKKNAFDSKLKGQSNISYSDFINLLVNNKIRYTIDEDIRDLPPRSKRYSGKFTVMKSSLPTNDYNGKYIKTYTLSNLEYSDNRTSMKNTRILSVGDFLEVDTNPVTTRYRVNHVDSNTNQVQLELVEGGTGISTGTVLKISSTQDMDLNIEIPVGYDEREVIFIKPIDPASNIPANEWSPGVGFYTNELTYTDANGNVQTLQKFYQQYVVDFGQIILSYAKDYYPTIREAIKPDAPELLKSNFKVVKINDQLSEYIDSETFRKLILDKTQISSEIDNLTKQISDQKVYLQTTSFVTTGDKDKAYNTLQNLINKQNTLVANYNSVVNTIKARTTDVGYVTPKYRIRGFWEIPAAKIGGSTGEQKIIKFIIRYRYLSSNGNTPDELELPMTTSNNSVIKGKFSNWIEVESKVRNRVQDSDGTYIWEAVDLTDPDEIKINQCDISIKPGEEVEIQVKSISEAGWPSNPAESIWSNSVIIAFADFPELNGDDINEILEQNKVDAAVAAMSNFTKSSSEHMSTSFYTNDKYFAHSAETITSGFLSPEQTPITLYDKLQDLNRQITELVERINRTTGNIIVSLIDDNNKIYNLNEGTTTYVYAGDYLSEINNLIEDEQKGAIITKTYQIDIKSDNESGLQLFSKIIGNRLSMCPNSRMYNYVVSDDDEVQKQSLSNGSIVNFTFNESIPPKDAQIPVKQPNIGGIVEDYKPGSDTKDDTLSNDFINGKLKESNSYLESNFGVDKKLNNGSVGSLKSDCEVSQEVYDNMNQYEIYDNVLTPQTLNSNYYATYGRYDLVPINLSNSEVIDYQIASPNMYQSAQCCGQFIYARFTNIGGTMNLYANTIDNDGYASYSDIANFSLAEKVYGIGDEYESPVWKNVYKDTDGNFSEDKVKTEFQNMVGEEIAGGFNGPQFAVILNRLPRTFQSRETLSSKFSTDKKIITRLNNNKSSIGENLRYNKLLAQRLNNYTSSNSFTYSIKPKVQTAYGFGNIVDDVKRADESENQLLGVQGNVFLTTHKIGFEEKDRYALGEGGCDSFLFLSPTNHNSIQVDGDNAKSSVKVSKTQSIKVPLIYQYRMTDYNGYIFGNVDKKPYDSDVKNTKFANIIGIDIWSDTLSDIPKQYDIVIYSTYSGQTNTDTGNVKTSTQQIIDALNNITINNTTLLEQAQRTSK